MRLFEHKPHKYRIKNVNLEHDDSLSFGERVADAVANFVGSWKFVISQSVILCIWMIINVLWFFYHFDPYPFIAMNLLLSAQAAYATPLIMMSQNRQAAKDRLTADHDYQINLKAEEETRQLIQHLYEQDAELLKQTKLLIELQQRSNPS